MAVVLQNLRTAPQSKDQQLTRGNLALSRNVETGNVVRVIRGYKLKEFSPFAPDDGYRYDGTSLALPLKLLPCLLY